MKYLVFIAAALSLSIAHSQLTPQSSPAAKVEQRVGLTDLTINYSRPGKKDREIFGKLVPFGEVWRTGANENTVFTTSDNLVFGKDTLKAGTYALYTIPNKDQWQLIFYKDHSNWGNPEKWSEAEVALKVSAVPMATSNTQETFTLAFDNIQTNGAELIISWDKTSVHFPFSVPTDANVMAAIQKTMSGPSAGDLNGAAAYYLETGRDLKQALEWSTKACNMNPDAFWMLHTKARIQAGLGDKKAALESAKKGKELAQKAGYEPYVTMFDTLIKDWSK